MDCTIDFLSGISSVKNILECKLAALPERQQCKKVIAWSRDFGMDQYVSWGLPKDQLTLETIWARFYLLTSFRQGNKSMDKWYNTVQAQVNLTKYPPETVKILHGDIFCFSLRDEEIIFRTISDGSVNLEKFPASKV